MTAQKIPASSGQSTPTRPDAGAPIHHQPIHPSLRDGFLHPPTTHGPVPFYWWAGEKLDRNRITWQLDQLCDQGVHQTIISYPHLPNGENDPGDPPIFSPEWWNLLRWFLKECAKRGMTAGIQDYTLVEPILKEIARNTPHMRGGQMFCASAHASLGTSVELSPDPGNSPICACAYPLIHGTPDLNGVVQIPVSDTDPTVSWSAPADSSASAWLLCLVHARMGAFDPLHPQSGPLAIEKLYTPFETECPGEVGKTLNLFFQDELSFGARMPFWSDFLFESFQSAKGYDLRPLLPALWHDLGPSTEKIRLDYADVVTQRMEDCYFKPVFQWHEQRGTMFGHDNSGRGRMAEGRSFYGDYFRTMRWYSAPGCDDPKLQGARAFKGLKVNSSIAHFNHRPRVWVEAFHSSGWGTKPSEVVAALNEDFAYGATVVNLHGLYYTTRAGWWEWAPPDFHFRQPYWKHSAKLNEYFTRLSWLLSQGTHRCDAAILYPIASLDVQPADPSATGVIAHVGNEAVANGRETVLCPEEAAFGIGRDLTDHGCDFDFIDFQSLASASTASSELIAGPGRYRVLILPSLSAIHLPSLEKARDFARAGGLVIAYGRLPNSSDHAGRQDPQLDALLLELFGSIESETDLIESHPNGGISCLLHGAFAKVHEMIDETIERDVLPSSPLLVLHRHLPNHEVYYVFNPTQQPLQTDVTFRSTGKAELWNPWTGAAHPLPPGCQQHIELNPRQALLVVFDTGNVANNTATPPAPLPASDRTSNRIPLNGLWDITLEPTLDNRFGDFALPAEQIHLGPEARRFACHEIFGSGDATTTSNPRPATASFGPRFEVHGPLPPQTNFPALEKWLLSSASGLDWKPCEFSLRWGIERDPFLTHWLSGPHGLKCQVPDDFIDLDTETPGSVFYVRTEVVSEVGGPHTLVCGSRSSYQLWINGKTVLTRDSALPPGLHAPWNIPHYDCDLQSTSCELKPGENSVILKLVKSPGQRIRAHFAFNPPPATSGDLSLRWFRNPSTPVPCLPAPPNRSAIALSATCPPGTTTLDFTAAGPAEVSILNASLAVEVLETLPHGWLRCRATTNQPVLQATPFEIRIQAPPTIRSADSLAGPVKFSCSSGQIPVGDWCDHGLDCYSGCATYSQEIDVTAEQLSHPDGSPARIWLDLGEISATANVKVDDVTVTTLITPPWRCDLTEFLSPGKHRVSITVANTLANHYRYGIPSPYAFEHQTPSGLLGPVALVIS